MNIHFHIYLVLIFLGVSVIAEELGNHQTKETECTKYCFKMFLDNTEQLNKKLESCEVKNMQMAVLQREIMVLKLKNTMNEIKIKEKEAHCKKQDEIYAEVSSISRLMRELSAETKKEGKLRNEMQKQIDEYKDIIEKKNKDIRILKNLLDKNKHLTEDVTEGLSDSPEDEILEDIKPEKYENSCLTVNNTSKILMIKVPHIEPFSVPCDGTIAGPGWTVIQRRVDSIVDFNRKWDAYKIGFGDLNGNLFIGLEKLYRMTKSQPHELYIHLSNFRGETRYAHYKNFSIGSEDEGYSLKLLLDYSGDAGDALKINKNMKFSTYDRDNDKSFDNCAAVRKGGWWYNQCSRSNLNGKYLEGDFEMWDGIWWWTWQEFRSLKSVHMLIRPTNSTL